MGQPPEDGAAFICTHHGKFHADEAMACAMLQLLPGFAGMPIVRTRDAASFGQARIVVDVGGAYDPERLRFDHHQKEFAHVYSEQYPEIRLSSAGLVYKHFGQELMHALCGPMDAEALSILTGKVYDALIRELDAGDNGVAIADEPRYRIVTHLAARVGRLNPSWREPSTPDIENGRFREAMGLVARELLDIVRGYRHEWWPARELVREALFSRSAVHSSAEVMKLPRFCPWQEHLLDLEEEAAAVAGDGEEAAPLTKYVVFADSRNGWRVQAVPKVRGSFETRLALPKAWCGRSGHELSEITGIPGCIFVHAGGFIGGHESYEGAAAMAIKALSWRDE